MTCSRASARGRRPAVWPGALLAVITAAGCGERGAERPAAPAAAPAAAPPVLPNPVLDRADLLEAVARAASNAASAAAAPPAPDPLAGRRFAVKIAFGCRGPIAPPKDVAARTGGDGAPRWLGVPGSAAARLELAPSDWSGGDLSGPAPIGYETIEGIWISHPWIRSDACPKAGPSHAAAPPARINAGPRIGLALLRPEGGSRLGRGDGRGFEFTLRGEGDRPPAPPADGYRLVVEGRLEGWADGRVVRCQVGPADRPPDCAIGALVDRVAFEDGATGAVLSEWRPTA